MNSTLSSDGAPARVVMTKVSKYYGPTKAVDEFDIVIHHGEVVGLVGSNGAGKSTVMKILSGMTPVSSGGFSIDGESIDFGSYRPSISRALGISSVYQELSLASNLSVYENFVVEYPDFRGFSWRRRAREFAARAMENVFPGHGIDVSASVESLSPAQRQMVEIVRAAQNRVLRVLILDEPTSSLTGERIAQLHAYVRHAKSLGVTVIYISHKLKEVLALVDSLVVMRNGRLEWQGSAETTSQDDLVARMAGSVRSNREKSQIAGIIDDSVEPLLVLSDFTSSELHGVSIHARPGEIVGISGLEGSGQQELLQAIFHHRRMKANSIDVRCKVAYVSGNRQTDGVFPFWNILNNIVVSSLKQLSTWGVIRRQPARQLAGSWFRNLKIKASGPEESITRLSGGNQQKALIARVFASDAELILLDDPTRGVDVETKYDIYSLLRAACENGRGVIWYSSEDKEMEECHRVYVLRNGHVIRELTGTSVNESEIIESAYSVEHRSAIDFEVEKKSIGSLASLLKQRWVLSVAALVALLVTVFALERNAMTSFGLELLFGAAVPLVLAALSEMFIILAGDIDIGLGAFIGLANVVCATYVFQNPVLGFSILLALIVVYGLMGALIHLLRIPAIIVTLGASFVWLGFALTIQSTPGGSTPTWLLSAYNAKIPVVPEPILVVIVLGAVGYWIVNKSKYGTVLRSFGDKPENIVSAGWSSLTARVSLYLMAGVTAVLSGMVVTAVNSGSDANASSPYTLLSIAAVVIGGSGLSGGRVDAIGTVAGALALYLVGSLIGFMSVVSSLQSGIQGLLLITVLAVGSVYRRSRL